MPAANVILYAQWDEDEKYTVTYDNNTGTGAQTDASSPYFEGVTVTVLDKGTMVKTNYTFNGWNTAANGSGTSRAPASTFTMPAANVILYAQWELNNKINYLLIQGFNAASGCTGLQETHEEIPVVPHLINTGLWLTDQEHTPNVKNISFVARFSGASTIIEYRYRHQIQWLANSTPEPWEAWSAWSTSGTSLGEDTYGYGFVSDCMYAPSKTSNPKYYCYQFEIEIAVNGDYVNTYLVNID